MNSYWYSVCGGISFHQTRLKTRESDVIAEIAFFPDTQTSITCHSHDPQPQQLIIMSVWSQDYQVSNRATWSLHTQQSPSIISAIMCMCAQTIHENLVAALTHAQSFMYSSMASLHEAPIRSIHIDVCVPVKCYKPSNHCYKRDAPL